MFVAMVPDLPWQQDKYNLNFDHCVYIPCHNVIELIILELFTVMS